MQCRTGLAVPTHGGAGTTGAGLRAGVPNLISPFVMDQFFWAMRVLKLGVGPRLPEAKRLSAETLAQAIQTAVSDPAPLHLAGKSAPKTAWPARCRSSNATPRTSTNASPDDLRGKTSPKQRLYVSLRVNLRLRTPRLLSAKL
jgi:hypothetical protein